MDAYEVALYLDEAMIMVKAMEKTAKKRMRDLKYELKKCKGQIKLARDEGEWDCVPGLKRECSIMKRLYSKWKQDLVAIRTRMRAIEQDRAQLDYL